jgi:hypothetical protein
MIDDSAGWVTVKFTPLLAIPETMTVTLPVVAPAGTCAEILVGLQVVGVAGVPLKANTLAPWARPRLVPVIVTDVPTVPLVGDMLVRVGGNVIVTRLLETPWTVTTIGPVVAPRGTGTTILVLVQLVGVPRVPLNVTVLVPCEDPKLVPAIVTAVPTAPDVGLSTVMLGAVGLFPPPPPPPFPDAHPCSRIAVANNMQNWARSVPKEVRAFCLMS